MKNVPQELNKRLLVGWFSIVTVLTVAYLFEVIKGTRTILYFAVFMVFTVVPFLIALFMQKKGYNPQNVKLAIIYGYILMYIFVMLTGNTVMVFTYIFPMLSLLILYHEKKLIRNMGFFCLFVNAAMIFSNFTQGKIGLENSRDVEIQVALIVLVFTFSYMAAGLYDRINSENEKYTKEIEEKSNQISEMVVQTITTIANTIDAKDEYTEGHSGRVAQYSKALALELGKTKEEAEMIYDIALLHDIGKIGVPDSILHKPGKLTDEEFDLIKQHPTIGGRILKDVKSMPDLEIGARYHHERFDGRGYPEGLHAEEIPEIARIICVADSFDAMNSNRVYRRHFTKEYIRSELEHCSGTQFDPVVVEAMLKLIDRGEIDYIDQRDHDDPQLNTASTRSMPHHDAERRHSSGEVMNDLEELSQRMREVLKDAEKERSLLEKLGDEKTVQNVETTVAARLQNNDGCLLLMDIDNFSQLNHKYGYLCGDDCLNVIAETLTDPEKNFIVCRYEGDSFLAYADGVSSADAAEEMIRSLRSDLREAFEQHHNLRDITVSIGASLSVDTGRYFGKMLTSAEKAVGSIKKSGKNGYAIYQDTGDEEKLASERDLDNLSQMIEKEYNYQGAFALEYKEFGRVYELIRNLGIRNAQYVQLVLFTILFNDDANMPISDRSMVMHYLETAINNSVRKVDVTARFSSTQRLVLFTNLPDSNKQLVIDRIMKEFYRMNPSSKFRLVYVSRNINLKQMRKN